ncbi:hypothetical protein AOQ73_40475 [Bradyrhizobium pachyrhizi]|nr:hypothetical protein AOQ73_40475 [Bradyrhizobium pachyrhizi]
MNDSPLRNAGPDESGGLAFRAKHCWHRIGTALTDDDDLPFPILIAGISAVAAIFFLACWFYITSKIAAIYFNRFALATDDAPLQFLSHCFAQLV